MAANSRLCIELAQWYVEPPLNGWVSWVQYLVVYIVRCYMPQNYLIINIILCAISMLIALQMLCAPQSQIHAETQRKLRYT